MSKMTHFLYCLLITVFFCWLSSFFKYLYPQKGKHINPTIFWKTSIRSFRCTYILAKLWLIFCCYQQKIQKWIIFDISMTITLRVNMITRQMTPLFSSTLWALSVDIFRFLHFKTRKIQFPLHYVLVCKLQICKPKITFLSRLTYISFFYIKFDIF